MPSEARARLLWCMLSGKTRRHDAVAAVVILVISLAYRAIFIAQGFSPTDEGWVQSAGRRILQGQIPYRDFNFSLPPFVLYREAALQAALGPTYTLLMSRWIFSVEAAAGSILAYLIMRRFLAMVPALLLSVPTAFFSVQLYYFTNYTYDGEVLMLISLWCVLAAGPSRRVLAAIGGVTAGLAALSKPNFVAFGIVLVMLGIVGNVLERRGSQAHPAVVGLRRHWPTFLATMIGTVALAAAYFFAMRGGSEFAYQSFVLTNAAHPLPLSTILWQDLPEVVFQPKHLLLYSATIVLGCFVRRNHSSRLVWVAVAVLAAFAAGTGVRTNFTPIALGTLLLATAAVTVLTATGRASFRDIPFELPALAFVLQYLAQYTHSGIGYSYIGAYLSLPVAVLAVHRLVVGRSYVDPLGSRMAREVPGAVVTFLFVFWIAAGSANVTWHEPYMDASRDSLTVPFRSPRLAGIYSSEERVQLVDAVVSYVDTHSAPGDRILVAPDYACLYFLADRTEASRQDWYLGSVITKSLVAADVEDLKRRPPRLVLLQRHSGFDAHILNDYQGQVSAPLYEFVTTHYRWIALAGDMDVWTPPG